MPVPIPREVLGINKIEPKFTSQKAGTDGIWVNPDLIEENISTLINFIQNPSIQQPFALLQLNSYYSLNGISTV